MRREIRLRKLEQNLKAFRPIVCAVADALHDIVREELLEALDWGLDVLEVDPSGRICLRRITVTACSGVGGGAAAGGGGRGIVLRGRLRGGCLSRLIALRFVSRRDDRIN